MEPRHIDTIIGSLVDNPRAGSDLVRLGRPALERLLAVEGGKVKIDFGSQHSTDVSDALTAAVDEFLLRDSETFFSVAAVHPRDSAIAWVLYGYPDVRAVPYLIDCLASDSWSVRWGAARALGTQGDRTVTNRLMQLLVDPDAIVRGAVIEAAGTLGDREAIPILSRFVETPPPTARPDELEKAAKTLDRLSRTSLCDPSTSPSELALRLISNFREWAKADARFHQALASVTEDVQYLLDSDLLWRASGNPSASAGDLFGPFNEKWALVFAGESPWVNATFMLTQARAPIVGLATLGQRKDQGTPHADRIAVALDYEPRELELR
jgi:HEAT repeat protein